MTKFNIFKSQQTLSPKKFIMPSPKDFGLKLEHVSFKDLDPAFISAFKKFVKEDFNDIPLEEISHEECYTTTLQNKAVVVFIHLFYDGSYTGTDPCFGHVVFSLRKNEAQARLLLNDIECAS